MELGRIQGLPNVFGYPLLSQEWIKLGTSDLASSFTGPIRIKAHKKIWRKGSIGVPRAAKIFWVPLLSQDRVKLQTSNFVGTFIWWIGTKANKKFWE